jgi:integrase
MRVWDEEQVRMFIAEAKRSSQYYLLYLAAVLTGMRQGELLGLRWKDVNFTQAVA